MTTLEKLRQHCNVRKDGSVYEFKYVEEDLDGIRQVKTYRSFDTASRFISSDNGENWTDKMIKPKTPASIRVGIGRSFA